MRTLIVSIALALPALAQGPQPPSEELDRYEPLLGSWEGRGTAAMPDGKGEWTSKSHTRRVLNGHFVRTDTRIEVGGEMPGALAFITYYGWDPEREEHRYYEVSNMGTLTEGEVVWLDDSTMVVMAAREEMGEHKVVRWITNLKGDQHEFVGEEAVGTGPWHEHVRGTMKKLENERPVSLEGIGAFMMQPGPEMQKALAMAGEYELEGSFRMTPEMPAMDITGQETAKPLFGGMLLEFETVGQPGDWEGWGAFAWDAAADRYRSVGLSNMGMAHVNDGWLRDGTWIFTGAGLFMGQPTVSRMVMQTNDEGKITGLESHSISGTADPYLSFEATYAPAGAAGARPASSARGEAEGAAQGD